MSALLPIPLDAAYPREFAVLCYNMSPLVEVIFPLFSVSGKTISSLTSVSFVTSTSKDSVVSAPQIIVLVKDVHPSSS